MGGADFELSKKQFECRYSENYENHFCFYNNFQRAELDPDLEYDDKVKSFEDYFFESLENTVSSGYVKILIIDNLTYLKGDTERARDALPLMKYLQNLKKKSILLLLVTMETSLREQELKTAL